MDFLDLAKSRYSVRQYTSRPVEAEKLATVLAAAQVAPTACNKQPQRLLVLQEAESLAKLAKSAKTYGAPCAIVICADISEAWIRSLDQKSSAAIDASIITDHMMLACTSLGLGSVWICNFDAQILLREFHLPPQWEPINILILGYDADVPASPGRHSQTRKPLTQTVFYEHL